MEIKRSKEAVVQTSIIERQRIEISGSAVCALIRQSVVAQFPDKEVVSISWDTKIKRSYSLDAGMGSQPESEYVDVLGAVVELVDKK